MLKENGKVIFEIKDNGIGLDELQASSISGLGIKGMKERAYQMGTNLILENNPAGGTLLRIEVPDDGND